jgi:hypothetical protein
MSSKTKQSVKVPKALAGPATHDPSERLELVVKLARADLRKVTAAGVIQADRDVRAVCGVRFGFFAPGNARAVQRVRRSLLALQSDVRGILESVVAGRQAHADALSRAAASPLKFHRSDETDTDVYVGETTVTFGGPKTPHLATAIRVTVHVGLGYCRLGGAARDMFLLEVQRLLDSNVSERLRACPNCGTPFVRIRRQAYCSEECRDRNYYEEWKKRPEAEASRRRTYAKNGWTRGARKKV